MSSNILKPAIKILLIWYDRPGCQETSYSDRTLKTCLAWVKNNLEILTLFKKESKDSLRVFPKVCQYAG